MRIIKVALKIIGYLLVAILLLIVGYKGYWYIIKNWYSDTTVTVRLVEEDRGCDFEDLLFRVDSVYNYDEKVSNLISSVVLPVFPDGADHDYSMIYKMQDGVIITEDDSSTVVVAKGRIAVFSNLESWYGCEGSRTFMIEDILSVRRVGRNIMDTD